eukprot:jgi/Chrzof1/12348/Cz06g31120.t1
MASLKNAGLAMLASAAVFTSAPAFADLNRLEAEVGGEFGRGTALQYGEADLKGRDFSGQVCRTKEAVTEQATVHDMPQLRWCAVSALIATIAQYYSNAIYGYNLHCFEADCTSSAGPEALKLHISRLQKRKLQGFKLARGILHEVCGIQDQLRGATHVQHPQTSDV